MPSDALKALEAGDFNAILLAPWAIHVWLTT